LDRDADAVEPLRAVAEVLVADIESSAWPLADRQFDLVLVTNYLWRPLWPQVLGGVRPGGLLVYETFARGNETVGRPARPDFLLEPGELLAVCRDWRVLGYEDGFLDAPPRFVQRIVARRPGADDRLPPGLPPG
jgi:SAM-dependent methyltransferase